MTNVRPLLQVDQLKKHFPTRRKSILAEREVVHAVDGVSFSIGKGETLALVGESGCGKSTVGRAILRLFDLTAGRVILNGQRIDNLSQRRLRALRQHVQVIFQDPFSSLNPRWKVRDILSEPILGFRLHSSAADLNKRLSELLDQVRLPASALDRWPHEFSGGQRQRISIARALASKPDLIICDEAVSALDVSVKAQVVNLLCELQKSLGMALLFISHDLAIVRQMTDRVAVMYLGRIVELASREALFLSPRHPYTQALLSAVPIADPDAPRKRIVLTGDVPNPINPPTGCHFHTRCPRAADRCKSETPILRDVGIEHSAACHFA